MKKQKKTNKNKKYNTEFIEISKNLVASGHTEKDLANVLSVAPTTIKTWKQRYPEFALACKEGKNIAVAYVASRGLMAAAGYEYEEITEVFKPIMDEEGKITEDMELVSRKVNKKHHAPNAGLVQFFLINNSDDYTAISKVDAGTKDKGPVTVGGEAHDKIKRLAGVFMDSTKEVESKVIDTEFENDVKESEVLQDKELTITYDEPIEQIAGNS